MSVAATLTPDEASRRDWGAAVVGAGPAGALAARELARCGVAVLLIDRADFPRGKVCGCCLNGHALATLRTVGLNGLAERCGAVPLAELALSAGGRPARVPLAGGVALSREAFDAALVEAAVKAGAAFLPRTRAALDGEEQGGRFLLLYHGAESVRVAARVVLAADGLGSALLARAGLSAAPAAPGARIGAGVVLEPGTRV